MKLVVKNNSLDTFTYTDGVTSVSIAPGTTNVPSASWFVLYGDTNFIKDIRLNNVVINDGISDYETVDAENYVRFLNDSFDYNNRDADGATIVRNKAAKKGWSFWALAPEITTSTIGGSLYCKSFDGTDIPWITCKIYDSNDAEITTPGTLNANLATCVKTVLDFEPTFNFEIIGGSLRVNSNPSADVRLWIIGAPDIPAIFGGSKEFASGINVKFLAPDSSFDIDGRVTKSLIYDPVTHQGKMRIMLLHPAGTQLNIQIVIQIYRQ